MKKISLLLLLLTSIFAKDLTFSKEVYNALNSANKQINAKKYKNAITTLKQVKTDKKEEIAYIKTILANAYLQMDDFKNARINLESAINSKILPKDLQKNSLYNLLQIYLLTKNHKKAIATFNQYKLYVKKVDTTLYGNIATSYTKIKNYKQALKYIKIALNKNPKNANFIQVLLAIYYEKHDYKNLCLTLESAYRLNILKSSYIKQIAYCLYKNKAPLRGANFLSNALKKGKVSNTKDNQKLLFNLYLDAKEYDKAYEIAKQLKNPTLALSVIQSYFDKGKYKKTINAINTFEKSFNKKTKPLTTLLKAQSHYYLHEVKQSIDIFKLALKYPTTKQIAKDWIEFIKE